MRLTGRALLFSGVLIIWLTGTSLPEWYTAMYASLLTLSAGLCYAAGGQEQ